MNTPNQHNLDVIGLRRKWVFAMNVKNLLVIDLEIIDFINTNL